MCTWQKLHIDMCGLDKNVYFIHMISFYMKKNVAAEKNCAF